MQASRVSGRAPVVATPVGAAPSAPASAATVAVAGPLAAPAPQAIVAPAIQEIAADAGRAEVVGAVAQAVWMPATTLWQAVKDGAGNAATQVLLSDVLVARAAELDPGMLTTILKQLPSALRSAAQPNDTAAITVAENLVEALLALMPRLSAAQLKTGQGQLQRLRLVDVPAGVVARLDALKTAWSTAMAEPTAFNIATKPLRTDAVLPLEAAEAQALRSVVAVDLEPVVNAKIPADLPLVSVPFARDYYSKGWLGRPEPGVLVTDTGNALVPGIIDHHQLGERTCAAALVLNRAELLVEQHLSAPITKLICHTSPDLDAVSSVFFAELILTEGKLPPGASRLAAYVSLEDNARCPVGQGDPSLHLATLCREAALDLSKLRHPSASKQVSPEVQRLRDDETLQVVSGILRYVLVSGLDPASPALLQNLDAVPTDILPVKTRADIVALQALVQDAEADAKAQLHQVRFFDARFPRLDGRGVLESRVAITEKGGKRLDAMLRERHGADVVVIAADSYTWTAAEPTSGASLRGVAAAFEAMERQVARTAGFDRVPGPSDRVQPGWSVKNPYYLGGTDSFIITPRGALLTTADRLEILHTVAGMRQAEAV